MSEDVDIVAAASGAAREIELLMAAFNAAEGIEWRPETMIRALEALLADDQSGAVLIARHRPSNRLVGYGIASLGLTSSSLGAMRSYRAVGSIILPASRRWSRPDECPD